MNDLLISVRQLQQQLSTGVLILDCRFNLAKNNATQSGLEAYRQGHIPGAHYVDLEKDLSSPLAPHGGRHPLPSAESFTRKMRELGLNPHTPVVVYDDSRMAFAARAWWLLRFFGHQQVAVLDGGYRAWVDAGYASDRREPATKNNGRFIAQPSPDLIRDHQAITAAPETFTLIDSREQRRYAGLEEPLDPVAGHIPGARNFPWQDTTDEQGFFKPKKWHDQRWQELADEKGITVYCGSGVTACVNLLSLEMAGVAARLYPGSWSDWCSYLATQTTKSK